MEENHKEVDQTVRRAGRKFQRRRDRNVPSQHLLQLLKQSREAAGLPLNPVKPESFIPEEDAGSPSGSHKPPTARSDGGQERHNKMLQHEPKSKPDERKARLNMPASPYATNGDLDNDQEGVYEKTDEKNICDVTPEWNKMSLAEESWQDNKSLIECNVFMFTYEIGCDVTLLLGETREVIKAHAFVLCSRNSRFANILEKQKTLDSKVVTIPDVKPDTMRHILRYLYTDDIELTVDRAFAIIPATFAYGPFSLMKVCFSFLLSEISSDNVCVTLEQAYKFGEKNVYERCLHFIYVNAVDVLKTPNLKNLCRECLEDIIKSDDLNADEFTVFEAVVMWANGECSRTKFQPTDQNRRKVLDQLLYHVRFAVMDVLEFTQNISNREVLTKEEKILLFQFFHGETYKLPTRFNKNKRHEYKIRNYLLAKAFGGDKTQVGLPNINLSERYQLIPYKQTGDYDASLSILRVIRFKGVSRDWQTNGPDAIRFRVSKPVALHGVQIFGSYTSQELYQIDIKIYDDFMDAIRHETTVMVTEGSGKVYDVILTSPVRVPTARAFTIQITLKGKPTYHGINGLELVKADDVTFQFFNSVKSLNGTDVKIGQIPALLFSKM